MRTRLHGIHHVTAVTAEAQPNADFYTGVLGLRLVKKTVNFDSPDMYHLYFGDEAGLPGSIMIVKATAARRGDLAATPGDPITAGELQALLDAAY